jgi:hypothetical protein
MQEYLQKKMSEELSSEEREVYENIVSEYNNANTISRRRSVTHSPRPMDMSSQLDNLLRQESDDSDYHTLCIGDIVRARDPDGSGLWFEGLLTDMNEDDGMFEVDIGDDVIKVGKAGIQRVRPWSVLEVGDTVQYKPPNSGMSFVGIIVGEDAAKETYDVHLDGDPDDEVERDVPLDWLRKTASVRHQALKLWKKAKWGVFTTIMMKTGFSARDLAMTCDAKEEFNEEEDA